jgi:hypothetical protein
MRWSRGNECDLTADIDMGITSSLSYAGRASGGRARMQETRNQGVPVSHHETNVLGPTK